jgi:hypothetical protein
MDVDGSRPQEMNTASALKQAINEGSISNFSSFFRARARRCFCGQVARLGRQHVLEFRASDAAKTGSGVSALPARRRSKDHSIDFKMSIGKGVRN